MLSLWIDVSSSAVAAAAGSAHIPVNHTALQHMGRGSLAQPWADEAQGSHSPGLGVASGDKAPLLGVLQGGTAQEKIFGLLHFACKPASIENKHHELGGF